MLYVVAFGPVLLFLGFLRWLDSYKLTPARRVLLAITYGAASALLAYSINSLGFRYFPGIWAYTGAPVVEELLKAGYWIFLIRTARAAFLVDTGICAFAIGTGFALIENFFYLQSDQTNSLGITILRGFGTALMHGGVAAIGAMISVERKFLAGLGLAILIHAFFNSGLLAPLPSVLTMLVAMPILIVGIFFWGEAQLRQWLGVKLDEDIDLLERIASGTFSETRTWMYLQSLQHAFSDEVRGDMLCMLQLTTELSIRAKGDLLLKEAGMDVAPDPELEGQFKELAFLEASLGPTGMRALAPLLSTTPRDLWEIRQLSKPTKRWTT